MKITKKVIKIGNSKGIILPNNLPVEIGKKAIFDIKLISEIDIKKYKCKKCASIFYDDQEEVECPVCECKNLIQIYDEEVIE